MEWFVSADRYEHPELGEVQYGQLLRRNDQKTDR